MTVKQKDPVGEYIPARALDEAWDAARAAVNRYPGALDTDVAFAEMVSAVEVVAGPVNRVFGVGKDVVVRWKRGENLPHPALRVHVRVAFDQMLCAIWEARMR